MKVRVQELATKVGRVLVHFEVDFADADGPNEMRPVVIVRPFQIALGVT